MFAFDVNGALRSFPELLRQPSVGFVHYHDLAEFGWRLKTSGGVRDVSDYREVLDL